VARSTDPTTTASRRSTRNSRGEAGSRRSRTTAEIDAEDAETEAELSRPRTGAKRTVMGAIRQLPNFLKLLYGLLTDPRVAKLDKMLVGAAVAYILLPLDFIPDFIPFLGEVDDIFVLVLALQRLIANAGRPVVLDYWVGTSAELADLNLQRLLASAAFFLPRRLRKRLRTIGRV
jgi:uncharacterized membrane protein YkvA (DUF1232 family)